VSAVCTVYYLASSVVLPESYILFTASAVCTVSTLVLILLILEIDASEVDAIYVYLLEGVAGGVLGN